jgi:hypothetical protein
VSARASGACLVGAAALFWLSWLLMPGVGVTDADQILDGVAAARTAVAASVVAQLVSAALYAPALVGVATLPARFANPGVHAAAIVLLVGAMGSAADAIFHLLALAMTQPGLEAAPLVPVMRFMQGSGLLLISPLVAAYFAGSAWLCAALARTGLVPRVCGWLHAIALAVAVAGAALSRIGAVPARVAGLVTLFLVSAAQVWVGVALIEPGRRAARVRSSA